MKYKLETTYVLKKSDKPKCQGCCFRWDREQDEPCTHCKEGYVFIEETDFVEVK